MDHVAFQSKKWIPVVMVAFLLASLLIAHCVVAKNLGVRGSLYRITEPDMLTGMYQKLTAMQKSGALARENQAVLKRTIHYILRPTPVSGVRDLPKGALPKTRTFNPSIRVRKTITDLHGNIIAAKGTQVNPLDYRRFDDTLVFMNADNHAQLQWVSRFIEKQRAHRHRFIIILVNGNIKTTAASLNTRVYFDQQGILCRHFHITHTPTLVFEPQHHIGRDKTLRVQEVQLG